MKVKAGPVYVLVLRALWIAGAVVFVGLLIYTLKRDVDPVTNDRYARDIRAAESLDAQLDGQVMVAREELVNQYDDLARTALSLELLHKRLHKQPKFLSAVDRDELAKEVDASATALAQKEELIERFKSENAVLRNSVRFFPVAALELRDRLHTEEGGEEASKAVNELMCSVLRFNTLPGDALRERAQKSLAALAASSVSKADREDADIVTIHARTVLERRDVVDDITDQIVAVPTRPAIQRMDAVYARAFLASLRAASVRRTALFVVALLVSVLAALDIIVNLRRAARASREASEKLGVLNEALQREKEREKELGDLKSKFVSMASHEFRTPLSVILSSSELLEAYGERWSPAKKADHFTRIKTAVAGMTDLLDDVLVIGRADMQKLEAHPARVDMARYCRELIDSVQPTLSKNHELQVKIAEDFGDAFADMKLLNHILTNLLSNAVKYSPEGGTVMFEATRDGGDAIFVVADQGIGIRESDLEHLFESFHRGGNVGVINGTGLGLAVVKRSVAAHGGSLDVHSREGEGTTFTVRVHVAAPPEDDPPPASSLESATHRA